MRKKLIYFAIAVVLAGAVLTFILSRVQFSANYGRFTEKELQEKRAEWAAHSGLVEVAPTALVPIKMAQSLRVAVGGLGLNDENQNQQLGDLITTSLTGVPGFALVERQSLSAILQELNLNLTGFVRAKDAIRAGKLLKVDWFLFGTVARVNGTNVIVARVVDARTGVMRAAEVFPAEKPLPELAQNLAGFMRQCREDAADAKLRIYLAIGVFEDLSANNRQAGLPAQLRGYLTAAYQDNSVTLLERESVEALLQEVDLDLAGLTEQGWTNAPAAMQSAYWLVTGQYQSYETSDVQLELNLDVQRLFGMKKHIALRGQRDERIFRQAKQEIDAVINQSNDSLVPNKYSEIRAQMAAGKELARLEAFDITYPNHYQRLDDQEMARRRRNAEEAVRAFETVLLLDPGNREAKVYLAACLRKQTIFRVDDAREYYRQILEENVEDHWTGEAREALKIALLESGGAIDWLTTAMQKNVNPAALEFYKEQLKSAQSEAALANAGTLNARQAAENRLFQDIEDNFNLMETGTGHGGGDFGMYNFEDAFGGDRAAAGMRLVELYPRMKAEFPKLAPQLLESVVAHQTTTNTPLLAELDHSLDWQISHPHEVYQSKYFRQDSGILEWSLQRKLYSLAVKAIDRKRTVAGINAAEELDDYNKISLGYAYMGISRWKDALDIFESYSNRPVVMESDGPWGAGWTVDLTSEQSRLCRSKLGLPVSRNSREFEMGDPVLCLCTPSTFTANDDGLWIGIGGQLLNLGFDLKTNLVINLSLNPSTRINAICETDTKVWIATAGEGLIEFGKKSHKCRRFKVEDGLMMNRISCLNLVGDTLWIGYGYKPDFFGVDMSVAQNGGLGQMDVVTHKFTSFSPSIAASPDADSVNADNLGTEPANMPTRRAIQSLAASPNGTVWFAIINQPLRVYRKAENAWNETTSIRCRTLAADANYLFAGEFWNVLDPVQKKTPRPLGVDCFDIKENHWSRFGLADGLPPTLVSTMTIHNGDLWIGGAGYIARADPRQARISNFAYVHGSGVDRIQIAGGYIWAQFDSHLYRAPLSMLQ